MLCKVVRNSGWPESSTWSGAPFLDCSLAITVSSSIASGSRFCASSTTTSALRPVDVRVAKDACRPARNSATDSPTTGARNADKTARRGLSGQLCKRLTKRNGGAGGLAAAAQRGQVLDLRRLGDFGQRLGPRG